MLERCHAGMHPAAALLCDLRKGVTDLPAQMQHLSGAEQHLREPGKLVRQAFCMPSGFLSDITDCIGSLCALSCTGRARIHTFSDKQRYIGVIGTACS